MFKKSKSNKNLTPPGAPSLTEVLSDLETFQVDIPIQHTSHRTPTEMESSWNSFEQFIVDLKCLEMVHNDMEGYKIELESHKLKIATEAKIMKNEIEDQQNLIKAALE